MRTLGPALLALAACAPPLRPPPGDLAALCNDYWELLMRESPTWATYLGDHRYDDRLSEIGPEARATARRERERLLERAKAIRPATAGDGVTLDILRLRLGREIEEQDHGFHQWAIDQMDGPQVWLFELVNYHPLKDDAGRRTFRARLEAFPRYVDQYIENLREGTREGRVATRMAVGRVLEQIRSHLAKPAAEWPIANVDGATVERAVRPAFQKLLAFLEKEYRPRDTVGLGALPGGDAAYRFRMRQHTTLDLTARELHEIGLEEMRTIEAEMRAIAKTDDLRAFRAKLLADPANFPASCDEYLDGFRAILAQIEAKLPQYFAQLPAIGYEIKRIEEYREKDAPAAYYYGPPEDGSRPGIFYVNCFRHEARPRHNMAALAAHEAVPGHHLQIAFAIELRDLPKFRRHTGFTAFVEGWALYAERLADEMGVYGTDLERFGMLTYQAWRAARLVVDTGLHAMGWTREQAIAYFREHLAISETEIVNEIDRYIIWPGQALAYKTGMREIQALRAKAEKALGPKLNLGEFHTEILRQGAVPLPTLRVLVDRWIAARL